MVDIFKTNAAEIAVPDVKELSRYINSLEKNLQMIAEKNIKDKKNKLNLLLENNYFKYPLKSIEEKRLLLDRQLEKITTIKDKIITDYKNNITNDLEKLSILNPLNILQRGYSIINDEKTGEIIKSKERILDNQMIKITFKDGCVLGKIIKK